MTKNTAPIMVLALMQRTGTNFLTRLLRTHPDCAEPKTLLEDFLVSEFDQLEAYAQNLNARWNPIWGAHERLDELRARLGGAVSDFLEADNADPGKRLVVKAPSADGVEHAHRFLPDTPIVMITRTGPCVVESGMRSFGWDFEKASWLWKGAVEHLTAAQEARARDGAPPMTVVKYEELVTDLEPTLRRICDAVDLDPNGFDFDTLRAFPVYGSSTDRGAEGDVNWNPVERPKAFDPLGRAKHWPAATFQRFDYLTNGLSRTLGYDLPATYEGGGSARLTQRLRTGLGRLPGAIGQAFSAAPPPTERA